MENKIWIFGLINFALLIMMYKWSLVDFYQKKVKWPKWCEFCFCFWASVVEFFLLFVSKNQFHFHTEIISCIVLYSLASAGLTAFLSKP